MSFSRASIVAIALKMDRLEDALWFRKESDGGEDGDHYVQTGVPCKARRTKPSYTQMTVNRLLFEDGAAAYQVVDVDGTLLDAGFGKLNGYLLVGDTKWYVKDCSPTAGEVLFICTVQKEKT